MRDIEFRVWDTKEKYMFTLDDDDFFINNHGLRKRHHVAYMGDAYITASDRYILMQYTGLKDKSCVKIFEGDVLVSSQNKDRAYVVEFSYGAFILRRKELHHSYVNIVINEDYEVIGNIHENPELLEGK